MGLLRRTIRKCGVPLKTRLTEHQPRLALGLKLNDGIVLPALVALRGINPDNGSAHELMIFANGAKRRMLLDRLGTTSVLNG